MEKKTVAIVGAGNVGNILAKAFYAQGYKLIGIASKSLSSAQNLATNFGIRATVNAAEITQYADIVVIATPDSCISQVVGEISVANGFRPRQVVLHTSGSMSAAVLNTASESGAFTGCMHPLQSFADRERSVELLTGTYFALGGHEQAVLVGKKIVADFGGQSFIIHDKDRPLYHMAACIASNYSVALLHWATKIYESIGLTPKEATNALLPLMQGTLSNVQQLGATRALTGPVSRGDGNTIVTHLAALKNTNEHELYSALASYTLDVALGKGTVNEEQVMMIRDILKVKKESVL